MREQRDTRCIVHGFDAVAATDGAVFFFSIAVGCFLHTNKPNDRQRRKNAERKIYRSNHELQRRGKVSMNLHRMLFRVKMKGIVAMSCNSQPLLFIGSFGN